MQAHCAAHSDEHHVDAERPLGIDMMLIRMGGAVRLHPCVELNLRRTMGHVALFCSQKRLNNGTFLGDKEIFPYF